MSVYVRRILLTLSTAVFAVVYSPYFADAQSGGHSPGTTASDQRTDAERIAGVKRLIANDMRRQQTLSENAVRLNERFEKLADRFTELDRKHATLALQQTGTASGVSGSLEEEWKSTRDNLDQLIRHRKLVQQQLKTLSEKLQLEHDYLRRLTQPELSSDVGEPIPQAQKPQGAVVPPSPLLASLGMPLPPVTTAQPAPTPVPNTTAIAASLIPSGNTSSLIDTDERVVAAKKDVEAKQAALRSHQDRLRFLDRSIDVFELDLKNSRAILADAQERVKASSKEINPEIHSATADAEVAVQKAALQDEYEQALASIKTESLVIAETEAMLQRLHDSRDELAKIVADAERALSNAQTWTLLLESPLSPSRLVRWLTDHGPKVLSVVLVTLLMLAISRLVERRLLRGLVLRRSTKAESSGRAETLRRVFHSFATFTILTLGILGALDQAGVNVTVLLGGAAVLGAAIAFGSQHLIRDFFSGFMILIENQYSVGHVVSINTKSGLVEDITLRMTVLRDEEGIVHFIPHSEATIVSNMTYGWARAVFDVAVDYREDVDRVMRVLMTLAREMRNDPQYGMLIIDNPELQGVDRLGDTAVRIKFLIKTQPIQQWNVKRELLRRIKNKFDELGIAFAFPQYQVHLNNDHSDLVTDPQH